MIRKKNNRTEEKSTFLQENMLNSNSKNDHPDKRVNQINYMKMHPIIGTVLNLLADYRAIIASPLDMHNSKREITNIYMIKDRTIDLL